MSYNTERITTKERAALGEISDAARLRDIREWHRRLELAHRGGYHLPDATVETVVSNVAFLLRQLGGHA